MFNLRSDIKFSDGKNINSRDINYNFSDAKVERPNKNTIVFKLKESFSPFLVTVSRPVFKKGFVGVGNYKITDVKLNGNFVESITLVSAKDRYNTKTYQFYPSVDALKLSFLMGEISKAEGLQDVNYKNVSSRNLRDVILRISIPKELEFIETSRGYFSTENSTVVVNIGNLDSQEEGSVNVRVRVTTDTQIGKIVVVTANLAYTIIDDNTQEEVFAYSKNTIEDRGVVQQGALAFLFGDGFLPNTLLGWLLIILLIVLLILAVRKAYYESKTLVVSDASKKHS